MNKIVVREAVQADLPQLQEVEKRCFKTDRLSRRSFLRFIKPGSHDLLVLTEADQLLAYALILYRTGTNLARLYSIAVLPEQQGKGFAKKLLDAAEEKVRDRCCVFMRLEVSVDNQTAIRFYQKYGYLNIGRIPAYYEDGADAFRMEKRMQNLTQKLTQNLKLKKNQSKPYYQQTTDFTCGPASLMMAIKTLDPAYKMNRHEELQIWREATTIFMTAGHGGCSPHGLALSAWSRGFSVTLHINQTEAPFLDGVRGEEKKSVIQLVHDDFLAQIKKTRIKIKTGNLESNELDTILAKGDPVLVLISTWRLNRNKAPHWVYVSGSDENFVYINDPDGGDDLHLTQTDYIQVPIEKRIFFEMARFGQKRLRCLLVISKADIKG